MIRQLIALALLASAGATAQTTTLNSRLSGDLTPMHDPVIAREGDTYYVFGTGLTVKTSKDLVHWTAGTPLLENMLPVWSDAVVPNAKGMWAPDIAFVNGRWRLYYAMSTFGSNRSAIGLATSPTLDPAAPGYGWRDEGLVVKSTTASDFNAIDANFVIDRDGRHWLSVGSFWTGLKLFLLDAKTGKPADPAAAPYPIAWRPAPGAVEAPFILDHGGYYWLFASYDFCCRGAASSYYTVVGRAKDITGPYLGQPGTSMLRGGGTEFLRADRAGKERFRGTGHVGFLHDKDGTDYVAYHAYDRDHGGVPTLRIARVTWGPDGWPKAEK